jgi:hypothetical protein
MSAATPITAAVMLIGMGTAALAGFQELKKCNDCVAAGYGWSVSKQRCGGFGNRECPADMLPSGHHRQPLPSPVAAAGAVTADGIVTLLFDGKGKLGLAFAKNQVPLSVQKITPGTWAATQPLLSPGMLLHAVGDTEVLGRSYDFSVGFIRAQAATSSAASPLVLRFDPAAPAPPPPEKTPQEIAMVGAVEVATVGGKWGAYLTAHASGETTSHPSFLAASQFPLSSSQATSL